MQAAQLSRYGVEIYPSFAVKMKNLFKMDISSKGTEFVCYACTKLL